ncbi:hypothetical protein TURU_086162 [Turdus rufiventris]|nr:hypothetical protein TURU_086162 [Turdus rufiventris]
MKFESLNYFMILLESYTRHRGNRQSGQTLSRTKMMQGGDGWKEAKESKDEDGFGSNRKAIDTEKREHG